MIFNGVPHCSGWIEKWDYEIWPCNFFWPCCARSAVISSGLTRAACQLKSIFTALAQPLDLLTVSLGLGLIPIDLLLLLVIGVLLPLQLITY